MINSLYLEETEYIYKNKNDHFVKDYTGFAVDLGLFSFHLLS